MKRFFILMFVLLLILIGSPIAFIITNLQSTPIVTQRAASTPKDAARTKEILREIRTLTESDSGRQIRLSEADMNGILAFSMRAVPSVRAQANVASNAIWLKMAADARRLPGGGWLNFQAIVRPSAKGLILGAARLGSLDLPAGIILPLLGYALDLVLGDQLGSVALQGVSSVAIENRVAVVGIGLDTAQRKALTQRAKQTVRAVAGVSSPEQVRAAYMALDKAAMAGQLPRNGSVLKYIRFAMEQAHKRAEGGNDRDEIKAGLFALAIYCGHPKFQKIIGDVLPKERLHKHSACVNTTLRGRRDLRQHFTISAGLKAAGDGSIAFAIGEFKELLDSNAGGSGFSFDDLAADRAGIRFAEVFLSSTAQQRERMLGRMDRESALIPNIEDLPSGLSKSEFKRRYGDVNAEAYKNLVSVIDRRIDGLQMFVPH